MSHYKGLVEPSFEEAAAAGRAEPTVRPKVMRRPATFSSAPHQPTMPTIHLPPTERAAPVEENENLALSTPSVPMVVTAHSKQWQDDLRFGVAMLTILLLVNLALIAWLPHLRQDDAATHTGAAVSVVQEPVRAVPFGMNADSSALTVYERTPPHAPADVFSVAPADSADVPASASGADSGPNQ